MKPSLAYKPFMNAIIEKSFLAKIVIEFLVDNLEATYEDLVCKVAVSICHLILMVLRFFSTKNSENVNLPFDLVK